jgi:hypothetical protein
MVRVLFLLAVFIPASATQAEIRIQTKPLTWELDLPQGTAIQLGGQPHQDGQEVSSYRWEILEGEGGRLFNETDAEAIFLAPLVQEEMEPFLVRLTATYVGGKSSVAHVLIRVHGEARPEPVETEAEARARIIAEKSAAAGRQLRERDQRQTQIARQTVNQMPSTHSHGMGWGLGYGGWGWGLGYGGWGLGYGSMVPLATYAAPVVVPGPEGEMPPGEQRKLDPNLIHLPDKPQ